MKKRILAMLLSVVMLASTVEITSLLTGTNILAGTEAPAVTDTAPTSDTDTASGGQRITDKARRPSACPARSCPSPATSNRTRRSPPPAAQPRWTRTTP